LEETARTPGADTAEAPHAKPVSNELISRTQQEGGNMNRIVSLVLDYLIFTVLILSAVAFLMALMRLL
jgi:hypothetical protein